MRLSMEAYRTSCTLCASSQYSTGPVPCSTKEFMPSLNGQGLGEMCESGIPYAESECSNPRGDEP